MRMQSKLIFVLTYLALDIIAGAVWSRDGYAASIDQQLELARQQARQQVYEVEHSPSADLQALRSKLRTAHKRVDEVLT